MGTRRSRRPLRRAKVPGAGPVTAEAAVEAVRAEASAEDLAKICEGNAVGAISVEPTGETAEDPDHPGEYVHCLRLKLEPCPRRLPPNAFARGLDARRDPR